MFAVHRVITTNKIVEVLRKQNAMPLLCLTIGYNKNIVTFASTANKRPAG